ncbi:MAG TPA: undecaprenyldiphospho-muramoylpentapeptide beta-N-acetylglucosaminyltransferase [Burkholderiales bacterium]|nr:undecaprenyldiphospho-muramoylpentapeptide beta-N-acetylglucosaminyltransferase [Burkholderiales bacterium]
MNAPQTPRTLMVMAGGTGGHIFPALSVAEYLRERKWKIVWLGAKTGMEAGLVTPKGYTMAWISMTGVRGKGLVRFALLPLQLLIAFWQSARAIFTHRPDVVLGMGGYVSFPGGMMASLFNRPLVIHEQNSIAGLTNRLLAKVADRVLGGFPTPLGKSATVNWTGNPVRADIASIEEPTARYLARSGVLRLTVIGGSLGAQALNETVPQALALMPATERPLVTHQSGSRHLAVVEANYQRAGVNATPVAFITDMAAQYAASDLIICRAGASTIAELAAAGVASVLVPFPHAVDDHQTHNARFLAERGAAVLVPQTDLTAEKLAALLRAFTRDALLAMAQKARAVAKPDATKAVAEECMRLAA